MSSEAFDPSEHPDSVQGFTDSGRYHVVCPGCKRDWYPSPSAGIKRRVGSGYCPDCGCDFRDPDPDLPKVLSSRVTATAELEDDGFGKLPMEGYIKVLCTCHTINEVPNDFEMYDCEGCDATWGVL